MIALTPGHFIHFFVIFAIIDAEALHIFVIVVIIGKSAILSPRSPGVLAKH